MSWHLASISSSGSSPLARTATHSSMGSSVDARWSARFGVALSVSATCACGVAGERVGGVVRHHPPSRRRRVDGVADDARTRCPLRAVGRTSRRRRFGTWNGAWRFVLPENPGRSRGETIDLSAAVYKSVRGHLEAIALLQRQRCGRGAKRECIAAGGYCSKEDSFQHIGGFLIAGTMRMVTATTARVSARPGVALVRESTR